MKNKCNKNVRKTLKPAEGLLTIVWRQDFQGSSCLWHQPTLSRDPEFFLKTGMNDAYWLKFIYHGKENLTNIKPLIIIVYIH